MDRPKRGKVPLLLINGMRMNQGVYNRLRRELKAPTISFDFPRFWWPILWGELPLMKNIANKVSGLIHELGYEQVDLLGASWGGALAIEMAVRHPQQIRNLVLVSTTARPVANFSRLGMLSTYLRSDYGGKARHDSALRVEVDSQVGRSPRTTDLYRGCALPLWGGSQKLPQ
jgi:pimeloyl-ACP methyl ester carboxylesterase